MEVSEANTRIAHVDNCRKCGIESGRAPFQKGRRICLRCHSDAMRAKYVPADQRKAVVKGRPRILLAKTCPACGRLTDAAGFARCKYGKDGLQRKCRKCQSKAAAEWNRNHLERSREHSRRARLKSKYGITSEQWDEMFRRQDGQCAICGTPPSRTRLAVDHCHRTGMVRGLLCSRCNTVLGHMRDDQQLLLRAIEYLGAVHSDEFSKGGL